MWAREHCDPIKEFERKYTANGILTREELSTARKEMQKVVDDAIKYADASPDPPAGLAKELEFPTPIDTDYNQILPPPFAEAVNKRTISPEQLEAINAQIAVFREKAKAGEITISEAANLAIHEEMLRDPTTTSKFIFTFQLYRESSWLS